MMQLGGSLTRQVDKSFTVSPSSPHIANIGTMIEEMENNMRNTLDQIYFGKTKDVVNSLRSSNPLSSESLKKDLQEELFKTLKRK